MTVAPHNGDTSVVCTCSEGMTEDGGRQSADEGRRGQKEGDLDMGGEESEGMSEGHRGQERRDFDKGDKESEGGHREQERRDLDKGGEESEGMSESNKGQEKRDLDKGGEESEGMSESNKGQEKRDLDKGGEKTGEGEEGESSEVERGRELQLVTEYVQLTCTVHEQYMYTMYNVQHVGDKHNVKCAKYYISTAALS